MKKCILLAALLCVGLCSQAEAQYYYGYNPRPYYGYYRGPIFYNANDYLRATTYNRHQFYNLNSSRLYLHNGMANTRYFYGF